MRLLSIAALLATHLACTGGGVRNPTVVNENACPTGTIWDEQATVTFSAASLDGAFLFLLFSNELQDGDPPICVGNAGISGSVELDDDETPGRFTWSVPQLGDFAMQDGDAEFYLELESVATNGVDVWDSGAGHWTAGSMRAQAPAQGEVVLTGFGMTEFNANGNRLAIDFTVEAATP
jgi:hypothetical protein